MKHFKRITTAPPCEGKVNAVLMGRKTWESIPPKFRPLPDRTNVVLTRQTDKLDLPPGVLQASSLPDALELLDMLENLGHVFCIGGSQIYKQALEEGYLTKIFYTQVSNVPDDQPFDAFFPALNPADWSTKPCAIYDNKENGLELSPSQPEESAQGVDAKTGLKYEFLEMTARNGEEYQYLDLCRDILANGIRKGDRTGTGTISKFGTQMRFSLRNGRLPLLTTKRTFWRGIAEELLWFIEVCE